MSECEICIESVPLVECTYCSYKTCKKCLSKYLLDSINDAECCNCHKPFTRVYLISTFSSHWYNTKYKVSRKQIMFDREKALFPDAMFCVKKMQENKQLAKEYKYLENECYKKIDELNRIRTSIDKIQKSMTNVERSINRNNSEMRQVGYVSRVQSTTIQSHFYKQCTINNCEGLLDIKGICTKCSSIVCLKCFELKNDDDHVCNPELIQSIKLLKGDSKNCPNCSVPIYRSEGCYQVWCTNCHTTFHYTTGEILHERIHNPHYIEWLANREHTHIEDECDGGFTLNFLRQVSNITDRHTLQNIHQFSLHIEGVCIPEIRRNIEKYSDASEARILRAKFLIGDITEDIFKQKLFMRYKQAARWQDILDIFNLFRTALTSMLNEYTVKLDITLFTTQLNHIVDYVQKEFKNIEKIYTNKYNIQFHIRTSKHRNRPSLYIEIVSQ